MLKLIGKQIDTDASEVLYDAPISTESFEKDWKVYGGEWWVEDGWLTGKNPENCPGMIVSTGDFFGNVMVDFEARTVLPSTHDIDVMWNGSWDETKDERGTAYVAGLEGWWVGKVGLEKSPDYLLNAATPLFDFEPGKVYHIQAGSVDGHCFVCVDGKLLLELTDPQPIDSQKHGKIGFEAYCSFIQIRNIKIKSIAWSELVLSYSKEF